MPHYNYKKLFSSKKSTVILKMDVIESSFDENRLNLNFRMFSRMQF